MRLPFIVISPLLFFVACSSSVDAPPPSADPAPPPSAETGRDIATGGAGGSEGVVPDPCDAATDLEAAVTLSEVAPDAVDPTARAEAYPHVYAAPVGSPRDRLLLFISGTDPGYLEGEQTPTGAQFYASFLRQAAGMGFHVVGITYANDTPINATCSRLPPDLNCHENVRLEVLTGEDRWPEIEVSPPDSLLERFTKLLRHLGWDQYLDGEDGVRWSDVMVAGHSQGGGHAAMLGKLFDIERAILFAATEGAPWTDRGVETFATPAERYFGFNSTLDAVYRSNLRSWQQLGIPGPVAEIENGVVPAESRNQLATSEAARDGNDHGTVVVDDAVPLTPEETPAMRPVWCYLLTAPTSGR